VIHVHHYPPGTSKWNKIEHRLFCHITQNWRGRPLTDRLAVVELIGATTTKTGLKVESALDTRNLLHSRSKNNKHHKSTRRDRKPDDYDVGECRVPRTENRRGKGEKPDRSSSGLAQLA